MKRKEPTHNDQLRVSQIFAQRVEALARIRAQPSCIPHLKAYYRENPIDFINDWGITYDPRMVAKKLPPLLPFILFPRQREFLEWVLRMWRDGEDGLSDKSRDMGLSWCCVAIASTLALFNDGFMCGFGSRKEEYVDKIGDPKSIFWKARQFIMGLPVEFRGGFNDRKNAPHMLLEIPETGSLIVGEAGDNIGRGNRTSLYIVDESAFLPRPQLVDAALSATTDCRIDISSVNGLDNPFAEKRFSWPDHRIFTFHWRDDPRKNDAWYAKQKERFNPIVVAQEIDLSYTASKEGVLIPADWIQAAVGACEALGITPSGARVGGQDVADEGIDLNAWADRHGVELRDVLTWSGKGADIYDTTERAIGYYTANRCEYFQFDADGLGAGMRGDVRAINEARKVNGKSPIEAIPFHGSGAVLNPDEEIVEGDAENDVKGRTNKDMFANRKAQAWWALRQRFQMTYRAVVEGMPYDPDEIISISPNVTDKQKLIAELSQPTYKITGVGKIQIVKTPQGMRSPNRADAVMICFADAKPKHQSFFF